MAWALPNTVAEVTAGFADVLRAIMAARTCCWQVNTLLGGLSVHDPQSPPPLPDADGPGLPLPPALATSPPLPLPVICSARPTPVSEV